MRRSARAASTHEKFGPAVPCRGRSRSTPSSGPGWARKSCGAAARGRARSVIGMASIPTRPMSWYSGSHDTITSSSASIPAARRWRRGWRPRTRSGIITPLGSDVDPLVYCRIDSRSGSGVGELEARRRPGCPAPGCTDAERRRWAGRPATGLVEGGQLRRRSAGAWRRRGGSGHGSARRTPRCEPIRMGSGSTIDAAPASQHPWMAVTSAGWWGRGWPRGRPARCPGLQGGGDRRPRRGAGPTARRSPLGR